MHIPILLCSAKFVGQSEVEYALPPETESEHEGMVFMTQHEVESDSEAV